MKKYIAKKLKNLIKNASIEEAKNIELEMNRRSLSETVDYITFKMNSINSVDSKYNVLDQAISHVSIDNGLYLEFGVFRGDSINYISKRIEKNIVYGFDSFEGLPEFWRDGFGEGCFAIKCLPKVNKNVTLIKGWFNETLPVFNNDNIDKPVAFLHVDCDLYSSTKTIFEILQKQIIAGTVIVFDEYFNYPGWKDGEYKAFQEFIANSGLTYKYLTYNSTHEQVAVVITGKNND